MSGPGEWSLGGEPPEPTTWPEPVDDLAESIEGPTEPVEYLSAPAE
jgi:hypothetical protein